jgi:hypothetical protein
MKKITIDKEAGIAEVIEQALGETDEEITLVIPKGSPLVRSVSNFHLLKREADAAGKTISIESVDDTILAFAKESNLEGSHPLWRGVQGAGVAGMSDIVPAGREGGDVEKPAPKKRRKKTEPVKLTVREEREEGGGAEEKEKGEKEEEQGQETQEAPIKQGIEEEQNAFEKEEKNFFGVGRFFNKRSAPEMQSEDDKGDDEAQPEHRISRKYLWIGGGILIVILVAFGIVTWSFGHVTITVDFKKTPWTYQDNFAADKSVSAINATTNVIPAQIFSTQKNTTQQFPASGNANVSIKAQGTITIYNAYSSAKQDLVATTRFVTPDGKLFRLVGAVTVPGAQVTNGKIVPSSVDAAVVADQAGTAYNVGPVDKLTIPGFQGSPKYTAFYGQLKSGTSGGFVGKKAVPTAADITSAKAKVTAALQANLASDLTTVYPNNFKILDGATNVQVTKLTVNTSTDSSGNFSVFGEAALQAIGFDESAFKTYLLSLTQTQKPNSVWNALNLAYSNVKADFTKGRVSFSLSAQGTLEPAFSMDDFKAGIVGKSINNARAAITALPDLADGKISVWPMWLWSIPSNPDKVKVMAN